MEEIVTGKQMKELDAYTIETMGVPSLVLMERAGLQVFESMKKEGLPLSKVLVLCGSGNNGADGVVIARLLFLAGYQVHVCILGNPEHFTKEMKTQIEIGRNYGISFVKTFCVHEYTTIVDALLGVGLSREVSGLYRETIEKLQDFSGEIAAVDIPSGIDADTGAVWGCAVRADLTVTFAYKKAGLCLYPGAAYAGKLLTADVGIYRKDKRSPELFACTDRELKKLTRKPDGNKGSFGKVFLAAGSREIFGAAYLSGQAALRSGAGMLKLCTPKENRGLFTCFPEAMLALYEDAADMENLVRENLCWADVAGIGPGLGTSPQAERLLETLLKYADKPLVIDADGLNLLKGKEKLLKSCKAPVILTPHLGEFARMTGISVKEWKKNPLTITKETAKKLGVLLVCKDARKIISRGTEETCINLCGNDGMATAGSGDVLTGLILGLLAQGLSPWEAACTGVYLHGKAGDLAAEKKGRAAMLAGDILEAAGEILKEL